MHLPNQAPPGGAPAAEVAAVRALGTGPIRGTSA